MPVVMKVKNGKYCVVERDTGKTKKCYSEKAPALEYLQVLNMAHKGLLRSQKGKK